MSPPVYASTDFCQMNFSMQRLKAPQFQMKSLFCVADYTRANRRNNSQIDWGLGMGEWRRRGRNTLYIFSLSVLLKINFCELFIEINFCNF